MINKEVIKLANKGVIIINVARGPIVVEEDVVELLDEGYVKSVGFDVFEIEPLTKKSKLMNYEQNIYIYGSHNGSNTVDAVLKTSKLTINKLFNFI
jgi:D-3-phosphoglycerate dehydrogenase / 2-oxoglutarate reductase